MYVPRVSRIPLLLAAAALAAAGVMAMLWLGARGRADDAAAERAAATAERDAAIEATIDANAEAQTLQDELDDARAALDDADRTPPESEEPSRAEIRELEDRITELTAELEQLETLNDILATGPSNPNDAETGDSDDSPTSAGIIGERISGLFRSSVLDDDEKTCLGVLVLNDLGELRVAEALDAPSPADDVEFVEAIQTAAASCDIDDSDIFG